MRRFVDLFIKKKLFERRKRARALPVYNYPEMAEPAINNDQTPNLMPEDFVPDQTLLNIGSGDRDPRGHAPKNFISYRVTSDDNNLVYEMFKGCCCVIAEEVSKQGVKHFHVVVAGLETYALVKKRLTRAKLGLNKYWSKQDNGDFFKAVSYTVKCGDYVTRKGFHEYVEMAPEWIFGLKNEPANVPKDVKDSDKDWMFTYNNLLRVCQNYARTNNLKTDKLANVLAHMMEHTRWIPSPQMLKNGIDPWYHRMYEYRVSKAGPPPPWWEERVEAFGLFKS